MKDEENSLRWLCHVCGDERPDENISVFKKSRGVGGQHLGDINAHGNLTVNVRFCNDRPECQQGADAVAEKWLTPFNKEEENDVGGQDA